MMDGGWNVVAQEPLKDAGAAPSAAGGWNVVAQEPMKPAGPEPGPYSIGIPPRQGPENTAAAQMDEIVAPVADTSRQIQALLKSKGDLTGVNADPAAKAQYDQLVARRDALGKSARQKAQELTDKLGKAGVKDGPTFDAAMKAALAKEGPQKPAGFVPQRPGGVAAGEDPYGLRPEQARDQETVFNERKAREDELRKAGVTQFAKDPQWAALTRELAAGTRNNERGAASFIGGGAGRGVVGLGEDLLKGIARAPARIGEVLATATGRGAREATQTMRENTTGRISEAARGEEQAASAAGREAQKLQQTREQIAAQQPKVAAERAEVAAKGPAMGQTRGLEAERVLERTRARVNELERSYKEAGLSTEQAQAHAAEHAQHVEDATAAADKLEQDLATKPTMSKDEFGAKLRESVQGLADKYTEKRAAESGYAKALESAGDEPRVSTKTAQEEIDRHLKDIRNPSLQRVLEGIRGLMTTVQDGAEGAIAHDALSVRAADSLRKYLSHIVETKMYGDQAVDAEALYVVKQLRRQLVQATTEAWQPYAEALAKWRDLSRPLDIVERKGGLKKVISEDPRATEYALSEAEVVGKIINSAKAGNPVLERLVAESPEMRDAARLYFTQDLFSQEAGRTVATLRTWLKANERPLRQLGLYDEFRNIRTAKETAQKAIETAKGAAKESLAQVRTAERHEQQIAKRLQQAEALRKKAKGRVEDTRTGQASTEERLATAAKRAGVADKRLEARQGAATAKQTKHTAAADEYRRLETELNKAVDKKVPSIARDFAKKLRADGKIDDQTYGQMLDDINALEAKYADTKALRSRLMRWGLVAAGLAGGYRAYRDMRNLLGM